MENKTLEECLQKGQALVDKAAEHGLNSYMDLSYNHEFGYSISLFVRGATDMAIASIICVPLADAVEAIDKMAKKLDGIIAGNDKARAQEIAALEARLNELRNAQI